MEADYTEFTTTLKQKLEETHTICSKWLDVINNPNENKNDIDTMKRIATQLWVKNKKFGTPDSFIKRVHNETKKLNKTIAKQERLNEEFKRKRDTKWRETEALFKRLQEGEADSNILNNSNKKQLK